MMRRSLSSLLLSLMMVFFAVPHAYAQDDFNEIVLEGVKHFKSGDYEQAIDAFLKARMIQDDPILTYNIARSYHKKGDCMPAVENYNLYINHPDTDDEGRGKAQGYLDELGECPTEGVLSLVCTPAEAQVKIGTQDYGACADITLEQGDYVVIISAEGYKPKDFRVTIKPEDVEALPVVLEPIPDVSGGGGGDESDVNWVAWGLVGGGALLLTGAVATDLVNLFVNESELEVLEPNHPDRKSFEDSYKLNQVLILTLGGLGLAAGVTGAVLLILDATAESDEATAQGDDDSDVSWTLSPTVSPDGDVGAAFQLRF